MGVGMWGNDGNAGNHGGNAGNHGGNVGIRVGMWGIGWECGECVEGWECGKSRWECRESW